MSVNVITIRRDKTVVNKGHYGGLRAIFIEPPTSSAGEPAVRNETHKHLPLDGGTVLVFYDKESAIELWKKLDMVIAGFDIEDIT